LLLVSEFESRNGLTTPDQPRRRRGLAVAAQIAAVVIVPISIIGIILQTRAEDAGRQPEGSTTATTDEAGPEATAPSPPAGGQELSQYLSELTPTGGGANLAPLPRSISGDPSYSHAIAMPCGSGQVDDQFREITYSLRGRYLGLAAVVRPLQEPATPVNIQVQVFRDDQLTANVILDAAATKPLSADLAGAAELKIRVTCELSSPIVILNEAAVSRA
jgi:hypothetical protein